MDIRGRKRREDADDSWEQNDTLISGGLQLRKRSKSAHTDTLPMQTAAPAQTYGSYLQPPTHYDPGRVNVPNSENVLDYELNTHMAWPISNTASFVPTADASGRGEVDALAAYFPEPFMQIQSFRPAEGIFRSVNHAPTTQTCYSHSQDEGTGTIDHPDFDTHPTLSPNLRSMGESAVGSGVVSQPPQSRSAGNPAPEQDNEADQEGEARSFGSRLLGTCYNRHVYYDARNRSSQSDKPEVLVALQTDLHLTLNTVNIRPFFVYPKYELHPLLEKDTESSWKPMRNRTVEWFRHHYKTGRLREVINQAGQEAYAGRGGRPQSVHYSRLLGQLSLLPSATQGASEGSVARMRLGQDDTDSLEGTDWPVSFGRWIPDDLPTDEDIIKLRHPQLQRYYKSEIFSVARESRSKVADRLTSETFAPTLISNGVSEGRHTYMHARFGDLKLW